MLDGYIICTTPRSGSTLLCNLLTSTKKTGVPNSYYHSTRVMRSWAKEWNLSACDTATEEEFGMAYLEAAIEAGRGNTKLFGLRLMKEHHGVLLMSLDNIFPGLSSDTHLLERAFGNILYIHLTRINKLAQAISLVKAEQSGLWHIAPDGTEIERIGAPREAVYNFRMIEREKATLEAYDAAWSEWFSQQSITPLRVEYELLAENPLGALTRICEALGVDAPKADSLKPGVAKLADEISLDWMRRFCSDLDLAT